MLVGCVPVRPTPYVAPAYVRTPVAQKMEVVDSEYDPVVVVKGDESISGSYYGSPGLSTRLVSTYDKKSKIALHWVKLVNRYDGRGWRFWSSASTANAESLPFTVIGRDVGACGSYAGCTYVEQVSAELSAAQIESAAKDGIKVRFRSQKGEDWFAEYSPGEVQYQLHSFNEATAKYR